MLLYKWQISVLEHNGNKYSNVKYKYYITGK